MVLNHTSGIYNYTDDVAFMTAVLTDPTTPVAPQQVVDVAIAQPPYFAPGQGWEYSNTNYTLAGMIIEAASGEPAATVIRREVMAGLDDTALDGGEPLPGELSIGYGAAGEDVTYALHPSVPWTAGSMVARAGDVALWAANLFGGDTLSEAERSELLSGVPIGAPGGDYGLGVFVYSAAALGGYATEAYGHGGGIPGFFSDMLYLADDGTAIAVIVNSNRSDTLPYTVGVLESLYP